MSDGKVAFVAPELRADAVIGSGLGGLAEDVRVDEELHKVSVDSDSTGTKKPCSGQAMSQPTSPSFA